MSLDRFNREELKADLRLAGGRIITGLHRLKSFLQAWAEKNKIWYLGCHWYTIDEWEERDEDVGDGGHLHLVAEGSLNEVLNGHYEDDRELREEFYAIAEAHHFHVEQGCSWSWHFYRQGVAGVFTPWAKVLCHGCHDKDTHSAKRPIKLSPVPEVVGENDGLCACSGCGAEIVEREDVAHCKLFVDLVNEADAGAEARLAQTGGMCVAAEVAFPDGSFGVFYDVGATSGENDGKPTVLFGIYASEGAHEEAEEPLAEWSWTEDDPKDVFDAADLVIKTAKAGTRA
jgi:hypothetical protein